MGLVEQIQETLAPELGPFTAEAVALHLCGKFNVTEDERDPRRLEELRDFLRRGLVAYVGSERAAQLAAAAITTR